MNKNIKKECESSCEYILPDYLGDVRKILLVSAAAIPAGKFVNDGEMHLSGVVNYNILYSDSENKLSEIFASSDYDAVVPISDEGYSESSVDTRVANFGVRLTGPRKLSAKALVRNTVSVKCITDVECSGDAFVDGREPEIARVSINEEELLFGASAEREYAEEAVRVASSAESIEIISSSGFVRINESIPVEGGVTVRGEIVVTAIIKTDDGAPYAIKKSMPFEETVEIEGADGNMQAMADAYLTSVSASCADSDEGASITVSAITEFSCISASNKELSVISDAYLKECETECTYSKMPYNELSSMGNITEKISGEILRADVGAEETQSILATSADVRSYECSVNHNGAVITGEIAYTCIACQINEQSETSYIPVKFALPFEVNVNMNCRLDENSVVEAKVYATDAECFLDGDKMLAECVLNISYHAVSQKETVRMSECSVKADGEEYRNCASVITVYYPEEGETLFEIAKRHHRSGKDILADNNLSIETSLSDSNILKGVKKLIIR